MLHGSRPAPRPGRRRTRAAAFTAAALSATLCACSPSAAPAHRLAASAAAVDVQEGITYWSDDQVTLQLDACVPVAPEEPTGAVIVVHGGGFTGGDRAGGVMRDLCETVAERGAAAFSIDYRLAPEYTYPAQVDDLANAVRWLREPAQAERFGIDPARIGVLGSSAGAIMAQTLATRGQGPLDSGDRVAAVVSLSGVSVLTPEARELGRPSEPAVRTVLDYLGCASEADCPQSVPGSPISGVDPSDPPMLLVNGTGELVPHQQAETMASALRSAGVPAELLIVDAPEHGTALLDSTVRRSVLSYLETHL